MSRGCPIADVAHRVVSELRPRAECLFHSAALEQCINPAGIEAVGQQLRARLKKGVAQSGIARRLRLHLVEFSEMLPQNGTALGSAELDIEDLTAALLPFES